jgi:hypothetical protein
MTYEELSKKYPRPILWTEYKTSVEGVQQLWMTGSTSQEKGSPILSNFHIIFKDGSRRDFSGYEDSVLLITDVTLFLENLKREEEKQHD